MTGRRQPVTGLTAAELKTALEADQDFVRERAELEGQRSVRAAALADAERPIVEDLRSVGVDASSVWDLVSSAAPYPGALPTLLKHLRIRSYPDRVLESLGRALAVPDAGAMWGELRVLLEAAQGAGERQGLAAAVSASAGSEHFQQLVEMLHDDQLGSVRVLLLSAVKRVGGKPGRELLNSLRHDALFGTEAKALLRER